MQFFGARCNLPKLLLYIMNGGKDEVTGDQVGPAFPPLTSGDGPLKYDEIVNRLDEGMAWLAKLYCNTMNVIHFMHDKYDYERIQVSRICCLLRCQLWLVVLDCGQLQGDVVLIRLQGCCHALAVFALVYCRVGLTCILTCSALLQMALHDTYVRRLLAFGISGLSVMADSLSAIKYGKVIPVRDERGLVTDFKVEGTFPKYGNDNDDVDGIAAW